MYAWMSRSESSRKVTVTASTPECVVPSRVTATAVNTVCVRPLSCRSILAASGALDGLPSTSSSITTIVSAESTTASGCRAAITAPFSRASRSACAIGGSPARYDSSMSAGSTSCAMPIMVRSSRRRGELDARITRGVVIARARASRARRSRAPRPSWRRTPPSPPRARGRGAVRRSARTAERPPPGAPHR